MLDLDSLAEKRAKILNQQQESWRKAIWSGTFQKLTQNMSDGEVESLISFCPSVAHLEYIVGFLDSRVQASGQAPYTILTQEAGKAGISPEEWVRRAMAGVGTSSQ
jgi:hypothetical protein